MENILKSQELPPTLTAKYLLGASRFLLGEPGPRLVPQERLAVRLQLSQALVVHSHGKFPVAQAKFTTRFVLSSLSVVLKNPVHEYPVCTSKPGWFQ